MKIRQIDSVNSTNTYIKENPSAVEAMTMLTAYEQFAGRGQRGNYWEAEPGKNLTFSFHFKPEGVEPTEQFAISEAVALAITDYLEECGIEAKVKWPNDIYAGNRKISGILIEHSILGREISRTIAGVGLNVNQTEFRSDAPNPVSMAMLTGKEYSLQREAEKLGTHFEKKLSLIGSEEGRAKLHGEFLSKLWRHDGEFHLFEDMRTGEKFKGKIATVIPSGLLEIKKESGQTDRFAFKEIGFIV